MRIVAILMIISHHLSLHGIMYQGVYDSGSTINKIVTQLYFPGGEIGVGLFFMLTGFFLVKSDKKNNVIKLLLQIAFYGIILALLVLLFIREEDGFKTKVLSYVIVPISSVKWWFVSYYILLILLAPQVNKLILKLNQRGDLLFLLILGVLEYMIQWLLATTFLRISMAVFFYCLGAYLSLFESQLSKGVCVVCFTISWIAYTLAQYFEIPFSFMIGKICVVVCCVSIFLIFKQIKIQSKVINSVAATTLGIYMIHDNDILRSMIWNSIFKISNCYAYDWYWLLSIISILCVFVIGMTFDYMRLRLFEPILLKKAEVLRKHINNYLLKK